MAFTPGSIAEKFIGGAKTGTTNGFVPGSVAGQIINRPTQTGSFVPGSIARSFGTTSNDTQSSQGLYNLAVKSGFQRDADRLMSQQSGEKTKEIFSGGFISDVFDVLNSMQYGVVGMLKGKTFSEGVKTRQSFTDQDALGDKGLPGLIAGIALDIAFDPLTYIAPATIIKKIPFASKLLKGVKELVLGKRVTKTIEGTEKTYEALEGGSRLGKYLGSKFSWMFGADPVFRNIFERGVKNIAIETQSLAELGKTVAKLTPQTAAKLLTRDDTGRFIRTSLDELKGKLTPEELEAVAQFYSKIDDLGKQAVDLKLLSKETFESNVGEYIKNAYTEYEQVQKKGLFAKLGIKGIKSRVKGLTPEKMKTLGQIDNPAYLLFKSALDLTRDVENAKLFQAVGKRFGTEVAQEGFTKLPTGVRLGELSGKYIPSNIASYLTDVITPSKDTLTKALVGNFKFFKVVMNPATHARNVVSNSILNWWKLGLGPWRADLYSTALKQSLKGGKWVDEAKTVGYGLDTFAAAEMKGLLDSPDVAGVMNKSGRVWQATKKKLGDIYQGEENVAKLAAFIHQRKKGFGIEEAWKAAESATFNYAQVTPFVRKLRESIFGFPFITFTVKSTPVVLETAFKHPGRISAIGKIKQAIEAQSDIKETDAERASEPSWLRNGFYIKLPMKDKHGRSAYFDLTYILPFGDLVNGNFYGTSRESGVREGIIPAAARKSPFFALVSELTGNKDFFGNQIWRESDSSDQQLKDVMRHLTKSYAPPLIGDQLKGGYDEKGVQQVRGVRGALSTPEDEIKQKRTLMQELLKLVGGKVQPIDVDIQETYSEWNRKKALQTLLLDQGVLSQFNRAYVPKSSPSGQ